MPVDPNVILSAGQGVTPLMSPMQAQQGALTLQNLMQQTQINNQAIQQHQRTLKDQLLMSQLASDPANYDKETGGFTADALTKIGNPILRQKLNQDRMEALKTKADIAYKTSETAKMVDAQKTEAAKDVVNQGYEAYEANKANPDVALQKMRETLAGGFDDLAKTGRGGFSKDEIAAIRAKWLAATPDDIARSIITHNERVEQEAKNKAADRAEETPFIKETNYLNKLKGQLADLKPGDPSSKALLAQINSVQSHINKLDAPARTTINMGAPPGELTEAGMKVKAELIRAGKPVPKTMRGTVDNDALNYLGEHEEGGAGSGGIITNQQDTRRNQGIITQYEVAGKPRQSIQSINAVSEHADTYLGLVKALKGGDQQTINKWKSEWSKQFGGTAPGSAEVAASIFAPEVVKAVLPGGGSAEERKAQEESWKNKLSGDQAESQIDQAIKPMIKGQYDSLKQGYQSTGRDIDKLFTPQAHRFMGTEKASNSDKPKGAVSASLLTDYAKKHNMTPDAAKAFLKEHGYAVE